jgi:signal transduction histidine kinase
VTPLHRVTVASRVFGIAAILGLGLVSRDIQAIVILVVIATVATTAVYLSLATPLATALVVTVEAAVIGLIIGLALPSSVVFIPYLIVLTLVAGISRGIVGVSAVVLAQISTFALVTTASTPLSRDDLLPALSPWLLTSIGMGLLGAWLHKTGAISPRGDGDASYESAHRLLTQLRTVARRLSSGLDPVTIGKYIAEEVSVSIGATQTAVFVRTDGGSLSPLSFSDEDARADLSPSNGVAHDCWAEMEPVTGTVDDRVQIAALPLRVGSRMIGIVLAHVSAPPTAAGLADLMHKLDDHSLRLDTALTFDEVRSIATVEERRRLAREIHDGIAQEVASLGYLVDDLVASVGGGESKARLLSLREELTRVVSELRLSIFDLRTEVGRETSLGSAISEYLEQVGAKSQMSVHLTLAEGPMRLRAETEGELLRIAQEAITNARKHSGAMNLWVYCEVVPPFARVTIRDDGAGLSQGRPDSYGLRIMKERAQRIDAQLRIETITDGSSKCGTLVAVSLGAASEASARFEEGAYAVHAEDGITRRRP